MGAALPAISIFTTLGLGITQALTGDPGNPPSGNDDEVRAAKRRRAAAAQNRTGRRSTLLVDESGDTPSAPTLLGRQSGGSR